MAENVNSGLFTWFEYMAADVEAAKAFYGAIVGLGSEPWPGMDYTMWTAGGRPVGGLSALPEEARAAGAPPHWVGTIETDDCDALVAKAVGLGATVRVPAFDLPDVGRWALLVDPQGAQFAVLGTVRDEPFESSGVGSVAWNELWTDDPAAALAFYGALFGWVEAGAMDMGPMGKYHMFGRASGGMHGGIARRSPEMPPASWTFYLTVDSVEASVARVREAGGQVVVGPGDTPDGGRMLIAVDPQGGAFALFSKA